MDEFVFFKILFLYLIERESTSGGVADRGGEAGSVGSREPHTGLDPKMLRLRPELKADA